MKKILQLLFEHKTLTAQQAKELLVNMVKGSYNNSEISALVTVFLMRSITIAELEGFRNALLELCVPVNFTDDTIDIVGTGGDGKNTFNISTLSCFIVAGAGQKVSKHGNYGATSISGSSNVMELLGYKFKNDTGALQAELNQANICFLHAPLFHSALKAVAQIRKELGVRTFFNMLGPLVNPARPKYQVVGVYSLEMARMYNYIFQQQQTPFAIVHALDGYDEISLTADTKVFTNSGEKTYTPAAIGKKMVMPQDIYGGNTAEEAATIFKKIIKGEGTWSQNAVVLANAALALHTTGAYTSYNHAYAAAVTSLETGAANTCLQKLLALQ
jgi:anthranilate phosphoribosyltransferase